MIAVVLCLAGGILAGSASPIDYVDPFIGTLGDHGHLHPGAYYPFGMVKLGPDTYPSSLTGNGNLAHSGYNYADEYVRGFSHLRIESSGGTSVFDRSWPLSVLPVTDTTAFHRAGDIIKMDKAKEKASPGYYSVFLNEQNVLAELTVTAHAGFHRYSSAGNEKIWLILKAGSSARLANSSMSLEGDRDFSGLLTGLGSQYFYGRVSRPFTKAGIWADHAQGGKSAKDRQMAGAQLEFSADTGEPLLIKIGFSTISVEQAKKNLDAEIPDWQFEKTVGQARAAWEKVLNRIQVEGDEECKKIFYTHLYHSHHQPSNVTDVDGKYLGHDKKTHLAIGYIHYDNYAFWDDFRTKFPLLSLIQPGVVHDIVRSIIDIYNQSADYWTFPNLEHKAHGGGFTAVGADGFLPFMTVRSEHMMSVVLDAYEKGLGNLDWEVAYRGMRKEMLIQMPEKFDKIGYIPARPDQTCEYCYDNWCVAQMAKRLRKREDYVWFLRRADYYRNTWDAEIGFFRAKSAEGNWLDFPESPTINREKYMYEGTPWQWRWFLIHNVPGLIELVGGREKFVADLEYFFDNNLYQAGNQPDVHAPFLFNYAGAPWLTQKWARKILTEPITQLYASHEFFPQPIHDRIFKPTPDGFLLEMDDDYGCMSAWYVMSAMGLYQVCPGQPVYQLTAPIFHKVTIELDRQFYPGGTFEIIAENLSEKNIYVQSAMLNGKAYDRAWIEHRDIVRGGKLVFVMGPEPNKSWGSSADTLPPLAR